MSKAKKHAPMKQATPKEVYVGKAVWLHNKPAVIEASGKGARVRQVPKGKSVELSWEQVQKLMERKKDPQQF